MLCLEYAFARVRKRFEAIAAWVRFFASDSLIYVMNVVWKNPCTQSFSIVRFTAQVNQQITSLRGNRVFISVQCAFIGFRIDLLHEMRDLVGVPTVLKKNNQIESLTL